MTGGRLWLDDEPFGARRAPRRIAGGGRSSLHKCVRSQNVRVFPDDCVVWTWRPRARQRSRGCGSVRRPSGDDPAADPRRETGCRSRRARPPSPSRGG